VREAGTQWSQQNALRRIAVLEAELAEVRAIVERLRMARCRGCRGEDDGGAAPCGTWNVMLVELV
jgi:hypothetical protein